MRIVRTASLAAIGGFLILGRCRRSRFLFPIEGLRQQLWRHRLFTQGGGEKGADRRVYVTMNTGVSLIRQGFIGDQIYIPVAMSCSVEQISWM